MQDKFTNFARRNEALTTFAANGCIASKFPQLVRAALLQTSARLPILAMRRAVAAPSILGGLSMNSPRPGQQGRSRLDLIHNCWKEFENGRNDPPRR
jgi:hypothetical protein